MFCLNQLQSSEFIQKELKKAVNEYGALDDKSVASLSLGIIMPAVSFS